MVRMTQEALLHIAEKLYDELPSLYSTDGDTESVFPIKLVSPLFKFEWWLKEYNPETMIAFGYANLNDIQMAELGYINILELLTDVPGLCIDPNYEKPLTLAEIEKELGGY